MSTDDAWRRLDDFKGSRALFDWYGKMAETYKRLSEEEKQALDEWERTHLDGHSVGTSDWPDWEKYIGRPPGSEERN